MYSYIVFPLNIFSKYSRTLLNFSMYVNKQKYESMHTFSKPKVMIY